MKKKHIFYLLILTISILTYIIAHNDFITLKSKYAISKNIEESKSNATYIKTFEIIKIENINGYAEFPIKDVWMEYAWYWDTHMCIFRKIVIDSLKPKRIIFNIKDINTSFKREDYLKNWVIKNSDDLSVEIHQNMMAISENGSKSYTIYKTKEDYPFTSDSLIPCFKFELPMD